MVRCICPGHDAHNGHAGSCPEHPVDRETVIAARGNTEQAVCRLLREMARLVPAGVAIVELGAYMGRTTGWLALGASEGHGAHVWSVDPWDLRPADSWPDDYPDHHAYDTYGKSETYDAYRAHLRACGMVGRVTPQRGYAVTVAAGWLRPKVGLLFHDAEHSAEAVEADLRAWLPHLTDDATVVLHDAGNPNFGVQEGAQRVLDTPEWDWAGRVLHRWRKRPERRGALVVKRC